MGIKVGMLGKFVATSSRRWVTLKWWFSKESIQNSLHSGLGIHFYSIWPDIWILLNQKGSCNDQWSTCQHIEDRTQMLHGWNIFACIYPKFKPQVNMP